MSAIPREVAAASFAGVDVPPPLPAVDVNEQIWGRTVADPWRHLENLADPTVRAWMRQQADTTQAILARLPGRAQLLQRLQEIDDSAPGQLAGVVRCMDGSLFFLRRNPDEDQFRVVRQQPDGT